MNEQQYLKTLAGGNSQAERVQEDLARSEREDARFFAWFKKAKLAKSEPYVPTASEDVWRKIRSFLKDGETWLGWCARTGLGEVQLRTMSKADIERHIRQVEANAANDPAVATGVFVEEQAKRNQMPKRFLVEVF